VADFERNDVEVLQEAANIDSGHRVIFAFGPDTEGGAAVVGAKVMLYSMRVGDLGGDIHLRCQQPQGVARKEHEQIPTAAE